MNIKAFFDGTISRNPGGKAKYGFIIYRKNLVTTQQRGYIGKGKGMTCNVSEVVALELLINKLFRNNYKKNTTINIYGDSILAINWTTGKYKLKCDTAVKYASYAKELFKELSVRHKVTLQWIPRSQNIAHVICDYEERVRKLPTQYFIQECKSLPLKYTTIKQ